VRDFYRILGIPDNATVADIKSAYRRLAKQYHPDLNPGSRQSEEKFKEILDAYTILSDEELRAQYDRKRRGTNYSDYFTPPSTEKKRDQARKEYPPEYIEMMRQRNRKRVVRQINRRKKILRGMIITFALYLIGTALFEAWVADKREQDTLVLNQRLAELRKQDTIVANGKIQNLDSPYDSLFGPGITTWLSPNQLVVINPISDAVICLVQNDPPYRTIRNEFIHARQSFIMKELPNGSFSVKVYIGHSWSDTVRVPDGRKLGGFLSDGQFFRIDRKAIALQKPTYDSPNTITTDTVRIDPAYTEFVSISREEFYRKGDSLPVN
jgi:curved DNA-binding protein CbpA